ncbi:hypothetical protein IMF27_26420 [Pseudomonas sp. PCH199]|nr:hypothetical protein [Pseudomonas sp. PCH199]
MIGRIRIMVGTVATVATGTMIIVAGTTTITTVEATAMGAAIAMAGATTGSPV